jgi:hypothetical protein
MGGRQCGGLIGSGHHCAGTGSAAAIAINRYLLAQDVELGDGVCWLA